MGEGVWWPAVGRDGRRRVWREYCRSPEGANEIEVQVGFCGGPGRCRLDEVGLIGVDEPEESCHVLAFVPPPLAYPPAAPGYSPMEGGYFLELTYDPRLLDTPPPYFPKYAVIDTILYREKPEIRN